MKRDLKAYPALGQGYNCVISVFFFPFRFRDLLFLFHKTMLSPVVIHLLQQVSEIPRKRCIWLLSQAEGSVFFKLTGSSQDGPSILSLAKPSSGQCGCPSCLAGILHSSVALSSTCWCPLLIPCQSDAVQRVLDYPCPHQTPWFGTIQLYILVLLLDRIILPHCLATSGFHFMLSL